MRRLVYLMGAVTALVIAAVVLGTPLGARNEAGPATTGLAQSYPDNPSDVTCSNPSCFDVASVDVSNTAAGQITVRINTPNRTRTNIIFSDFVELYIAKMKVLTQAPGREIVQRLCIPAVGSKKPRPCNGVSRGE